MSAIAQCKAILEIIHTPASPLPYLKQRLPNHPTSQSGNPSGSAIAEARPANLQALLEDVPFSKKELENGLIELCAVEMNDQIWLPSAHRLLNVWKSFISAANVKGTNIKSSFLISEVSTLVEEDGFPEPLLVAVFRKLISESDASKPDWVTLDRDKCVQWVGTTLLEGYDGPTDIAASSFIQLWQDLLHESWRELAVIQALGGHVTWKGKDTIAMRGGPKETMKASHTTPVANVSKGPSRWRDKFKSTR